MIKRIFRKLIRKPNSRNLLAERLEELENQWHTNAILPFEITKIAETGFLARISAPNFAIPFSAFISFLRMPWKYYSFDSWIAIAPKLIGKTFFCEIHQIRKTPLLTIR